MKSTSDKKITTKAEGDKHAYVQRGGLSTEQIQR